MTTQSHNLFVCMQAPNKAVDEEGWFSTEDVASINPLGFMGVTDRLETHCKLAKNNDQLVVMHAGS